MKHGATDIGVQARQYVQDIVGLMLGKKGQGSLAAHLARSTSGTFALKVASTGLGLLTSLLLARLLGAAGYGVYVYALSIIALLMIPATFGLPQLIIRNVAAYKTHRKWDLMRGLIRWADWTVLAVSLAIALLGAIIIKFMPGHIPTQTANTFRIALLALPLAALSQLRQTTLQGLNCIVRGQLPEALIRPVFFIILVCSAYLIPGLKVNAPFVMGMQAMAAGAAFIAGAMLLRRHFPTSARNADPSYDIRTWIRSAFPLILISSLGAINTHTDMVMLGAIKGTEAAGIYAVANRGAGLIVFVLAAVNAALAPTISNLYASGEMHRLQQVITKSARIILLLSLPIALALILFGKWALMIFGQDFVRGNLALAILSIGQLINAAAGSVGLLLIMTGYEKDTAAGIAVSAVLNIILNALFIPSWEMEGAAFATSASMILWNFLLAFRVYKRLGLDPTASGRISRWKEV